jgi:uncharacterized cupin superfamily protein
VSCPPGEGSAHQITNASDTDLKYLAISTKPRLDIVYYPDSDKIGVHAQRDSGGTADQPPFRIIIKGDAGVDYWDGEE